MSIYERIINEVIARLVGTTGTPDNLGLLGVKGEKLVQFKGEYEELKPNVPGRVMVGFPMQNYGTEKEPTNMLVGAPDQDSDLYIAISVSGRNLYDVNNDGKSVYDYVELTQRLLMGWSPSTGGGELSIHSTTLENFDKNIWYYLVLMRFQRYAMEPVTNFRLEAPLYNRNLAELEFDEEVDDPEILTNLGEQIIIDEDRLTE